jgi:hypothetical protein
MLQGNLGGGHNMEERDDGLSSNNTRQGKGKNSDSSGPSQLTSTSSAKQVDEIHAGEKNVEGKHAAVSLQEVNNDLNAGNCNALFFEENKNPRDFLFK